MNTDTIAYLINHLNNRIQANIATIAKFKSELDRDPHYAFRWAEDAMRASAEWNLNRDILMYVNAAETADKSYEEVVTQIEKELKRRVFRAAAFPSRSTSVTTNEMGMWDGRVAASMLEAFGF